MRLPIVPILASLIIVLGITFLVPPQGVIVGQDATPGPGATPQASPVAEVDCDDVPWGRTVGVPNRVTIELTDEGFDPAIIQSTDNTTFDLTLVNTGTQTHSFVMDDFDLRVELEPGESESIVLTPKYTGGADDHYFHGDLPGEECFRGNLILYI